MYKIRALVFMLICLLAANLLSGCSTGKGTGKSEVKPLRVAIGAEPETLDPRKALGIAEGVVLRQIFEGLATQDAKGLPVPGTAEKWEISPDQLTFKFTIRSNAKWTNGDPVTAHDFEYAWKSLLDPKFASKYANQLYYLKNGEAYNKGKTSADQVGVKALDDRTLQVTLQAPTPYFLFLTSTWPYFPVHKKTAESDPKWHTDPKSIVGNGPFKITEWVHNSKIDLVKNTNYWNNQVVKLAKAELNLSDSKKTLLDLFESNQIDTVEVTPPLSEIPRLLKEGKLKAFPYISTYYYMINTEKAPFDNPKVRKALSLAIDREAIVSSLTRGGEQPALAWVPSGLPDAKPENDYRKVGGNLFKNNDIETAKKLLAEAGYPDGKGLPPISVLYYNGEERKALTEAIQEMWKKNLGITVTMVNQEWKVYLQSRAQGDYQIAIRNWIGDYLDPMTHMDVMLSDNSNSYTRWKNPEYDRLVKQAQVTLDPAARMKLMHDAEKILMDEMPIMPIYFSTNKYLEKPNVKGVIRDALAAVYLREAYIE